MIWGACGDGELIADFEEADAILSQEVALGSSQGGVNYDRVLVS